MDKIYLELEGGDHGTRMISIVICKLEIKWQNLMQRVKIQSRVGSLLFSFDVLVLNFAYKSIQNPIQHLSRFCVFGSV